MGSRLDTRSAVGASKDVAMQNRMKTAASEVIARKRRLTRFSREAGLFCAVIDLCATDPVSFQAGARFCDFKAGRRNALRADAFAPWVEGAPRVAIRLSHALEHNPSRECN